MEGRAPDPGRLPFRELETPTGASAAVLLALFFAGVTRQIFFLAEHILEVRIGLHQRACNAKLSCRGLPDPTTTMNIDEDIDGLQATYSYKRSSHRLDSSNV